MTDILTSAMYSVVFLAIALIFLVVGWYVLDALTPGHKLGDKMNPQPLDARRRQGVVLASDEAGSHSAALVASAWMIMQAAIIFTAVLTNAHGDDFGSAVGWTVAFSVVGLVLQSIAFVALDAVTPGNLGDEICIAGPVVPLAKIAAANIVAVGIVVIACIS